MSGINFDKFQSKIKSERWLDLGSEQLKSLSPNEAYNIFIEVFKKNLKNLF